LRELYATRKQPTQEDKESAAHTLAGILEQAQAIGHAHATDEVARSIAWGGKFTNVLNSAWDIVTTFVSRIADWFTQQQAAGEDVSDSDLAEKIDSLAEQVGGFEVAAAIEESVLQELTFAGVQMVKSAAQPGACEDCQDKADADPVPINDFEPPPYHGKCRCSTAPVDEGD
jgi:hypothetical protein